LRPSEAAQPSYAHAKLSVPVNTPWSGINLIEETEKAGHRNNRTEHLSSFEGVFAIKDGEPMKGDRGAQQQPFA